MVNLYSSEDLRAKQLRDCLYSVSPDKKISIAYSGGLDSRFLSYFADSTGFTVELLHVQGPHVSPEETREAVQWAQQHGLPIRVLEINPLQIPEVAINSRERCYFCKHALFSTLKKTASYPLCDGTNHSDLGQYRPGIRALKDLDIRSPLAEAGLKKSDIREIGRSIGLDHADQASRPCILTRFPYDRPLDVNEIRSVMQAELKISEFLRKEMIGPFRFRLRKIKPGTFELHVQTEDLVTLPPPQVLELKKAVSSVSDLFVNLTICPKDSLSGFFDKH